MDFHLDNLLNFPHVTVLNYQQQEEFIFLKLELLNEGILCPHCQTYTDNLHQTRPILVKDLSIFGRGVYLKVPRRQFICPHCRKNKLRLSLDLKGLKNRCLLLKNGRDLTEEEKTELVQLLQKSPCLSIAYELKEEFRDIYETSTTVKMGRRRFEKWLVIASCLFGSVTQTIFKHLDEICNYFISGTTSGIMEGLNNKIKLILRQSYGFKNFDLMRQKLLACLS